MHGLIFEMNKSVQTGSTRYLIFKQKLFRLTAALVRLSTKPSKNGRHQKDTRGETDWSHSQTQVHFLILTDNTKKCAPNRPFFCFKFLHKRLIILKSLLKFLISIPPISPKGRSYKPNFSLYPAK
jgi:hypothetical protein